MPSLADQAQAIADHYIRPDSGRPSDIGKADTVKELLEAVGQGNYLETACKLSGLSKHSVYNWIRRGEAGETPFNAFVDALQKAEAKAEAEMVALVRAAGRAGPQFWAAPMTMLERRHPERFGKRQDEASGPKVIVNVGVSASDVKVNVGFASTVDAQVSPSTFEAKVLEPANSLETQAFALPSSLISAVMVTNGEACQAQPAAIGESRQSNPEGDPTGVAGARGGSDSRAQAGAGDLLVGDSQPVSVAVKGRLRAGKEKKGVAGGSST